MSAPDYTKPHRTSGEWMFRDREDDVSIAFDLLFAASGASFCTFLLANIFLVDDSAAHASLLAWLGSQAVILAIVGLLQLTRNYTLSLLCIISTLVIPVLLRQPFLSLVIYPISAFGLWAYAKRNAKKNIHLGYLAYLSLLAAILFLGARSYASFDMHTRLHSGAVHVDTLFHASIAAMLKTYGVVSTGVNGLVETPYHTLSHAMIASLSYITGVPIIESYGTFPALLFSPLLLVGVTLAASGAGLAVQTRFTAPPWQTAWLLTTLTLAVVAFLFRDVAVWDSYFVSESYLVSLLILMPLLTILTQQALTIPKWSIVILGAAFLTMAKASTGIMLAGLVLTRLIFIDRSLELAKAVPAALATLAAVIILGSGNAASNDHFVGIEWLHFIRSWGIGAVFEPWLGGDVRNDWAIAPQLLAVTLYFALAHFALSWLALGWWLAKRGFAPLFKNSWPLFTAASAGVGLLAALMFRIPGGSLYYVTNLAMFISLPLAIAAMFQVGNRSRPLDTRPVLLITMAVLGFLVHRGLKEKSFLKREPLREPNALIATLERLRDEPAAKRIYRAGSGQYDPLKNPVKRNISRPLVFPAVSERAWTGVLGKDVPCTYAYHGYHFYRLAHEHKDGRPCFGKSHIPAGMRLEQ